MSLVGASGNFKETSALHVSAFTLPYMRDAESWKLCIQVLILDATTTSLHDPPKQGRVI